MSGNRIVRLLSLGLALGLLASPAATWADDETTGSVTASGQGGSGIEDSSKLQQFETVPKGVFVPEARFAWKGSGYFFDFKGSKLGLDDQFALASWGNKDIFRLDVSWDQNPNRLSNTARTPFTEVSPGVFRIPDDVQLALQNIYVPFTGSAPANPTVPGFFAVEPWVVLSQPIDLGYLRKTGRAGLEVTPTENLNLKVGYSRESRSGNKNTTFYGGPDFEVATPIDFRTHDFRAEADYAEGRLFANAAVAFSKFLNDVPFAEIDNPERLLLANPVTGARITNDASFFRLWLPPDNDAYNADFTAGMTFPRRHKVTGSFSFGRMKMSTNLLPISTNPNLATTNPAFTVNPPFGNIEAKFNTSLGAVKFTGDPSSRFGYILSYRKFEMSDKTQEYHFNSFARGDVGASYNVAGISREPEGWATESLKGEVHVLPVQGLRLAASYGQDKRTYDAREFADVTDHNLQFTADYGWDRFSLHGAWTLLDRKPGDANDQAIQPTWQGASQTDITDRKRHILSGIFTVTPTDKLAISLTGQKQTNEFPESVTGLLDQSFDSFGADVTYAANEKLSLFTGYVYEKYFFQMAAAYIPRGLQPPFDPANLWENATEDKVNTFRAGFSWVPRPEKVDLEASFDYSKPRSDSDYAFALAGTPIGGLNEANGIFPANVPPVPGFPSFTFNGFPLVSKEFIVTRVNLSYHVDRNVTLSALWWWQKYDNVDWQTDLVQPYMGHIDPGSNRWFFLGARIPAYDANIFRASVTYRF